MSKREVILTGDRPTGSLHLGHFFGSLRSRVMLQDTHDQYVMIADLQALTDHAKEPQKVHNSVLQVALDYLAVGIDPKKTTIFIQSSIPSLSEITLHYLNLVTWNRLKHNPTVKEEIVNKGFKDNVPAGFMVYPISQAADITAFKATLVPVGDDQKPMIEQTNEIVRAFNKTYQTNVLIEAQALIPKMARLPGIDGRSKMGKSLNNAIFLSDTPDQISRKVKKMYTDPHHLRIEDPGKVEGNPVFSYLDAFGTDQTKIQELKIHYQKGGLGDRVVKDYLIDVLVAFLKPIRKRRLDYEKDPATVMNFLRQGNEEANQIAANTLSQIKQAMGIVYF